MAQTILHSTTHAQKYWQNKNVSHNSSLALFTKCYIYPQLIWYIILALISILMFGFTIQYNVYHGIQLTCKFWCRGCKYATCILSPSATMKVSHSSVSICTVQCELLTWEGLLSWTDSHRSLPHYQNPNASQVLSCSPTHETEKLTSYTKSEWLVSRGPSWRSQHHHHCHSWHHSHPTHCRVIKKSSGRVEDKHSLCNTADNTGYMWGGTHFSLVSGLAFLHCNARPQRRIVGAGIIWVVAQFPWNDYPSAKN